VAERAERQSVAVGPQSVLAQALRREFAWKDRIVELAIAA